MTRQLSQAPGNFPGANGVKLQSIDPSTGELIETFDGLSSTDLADRLDRASAAFSEYRKTTFANRATWMLSAAQILEDEKESLGRIMTKEMGKTLKAAVAEAEKCAKGCRFYAENAERMLADEEIRTEARQSYVRYLPVGPVLAVMPWNFPFWQVFRFAAPALMAGNVCLLKHASNVPRCAITIEEIFTRAGFPAGAFQTLLIDSSEVAGILDDPRLGAATLTGSTRAGSAVAERAGKRIKKCVLELGGSDPFIVMPSADMATAVKTAVIARTINNGQSCIAAKRFIIHDAVYDEFVEGFVAGMRDLRVGDPFDEATNVGPLATESILNEVEDQVRRSIAAGARLLVGGERLDRRGNFYAPTALDDIPTGSPAADEEIFGPVAALFRVENIDDAIEVANESRYGLGSSVWTNDPEERQRFVDEIEAGLVFVNAMVASHPALPFGGVKESGFGRELGVWGIREFVNIKTIWVEGASPTEAE
jgi:succinate-semialdehyde dehydrogenase / glutarate-semialdehyde dehydrogenase